MAIKVPSVGPRHGVRIMIVGEAPGASEESAIAPFVGASGQELTKILHEAGVVRNECFVTNVCKYRPPLNVIDNFCAESKRKLRGKEPYTTWGDRHITAEFYEGLLELKSDIETVKPNVIIALGDTALWALTGKSGITQWRGSIMTESLSSITTKVVPTYHPAAILRMWEWRSIMLHDIRRARSESETAAYNPPAWDFEIRPSFEKVMHRLRWLSQQAELAPFKLGVDIETRGGQIACVGLAWTSRSALCIPLLCTENVDGYWSREEELAIVLALRSVLTNPNILCVGQNFLYDAQYFASRMFFIPNLTDDTMFQQHVAFVGLPKALYFIASMYCSQYIYWKEDGKEWDPSIPEDKLWAYNCTDACRTLEAHIELDRVIWRLGLNEVYKFQMRLWKLAFRAMLRGVRINQAYRNEILNELLEASNSREAFIKKIVGYALNPRSPKQMHHFLYTELGLPPVHNRKTGKITANFDALQKCATREPLLAPIATALLEQRSIGVYISTFIRSPLDSDGRVRCSFNPAGTETYRLSSSQSAFGTGMNLQNIPFETRKKATADKIGLRMDMPNIRKMFVPDPGYVICDMDLDRADLQVVVWEANDTELMAALRLGADIHLLNGAALHGVELAVEECIETSPDYKNLRKRFASARQFAKNWVHGTNYGGSAETMAVAAGVTKRESQRYQTLWFDRHPGILEWHERTKHQLMTRRMVENKFGYRRFYFDRIEQVLPEALAWIPQSTVSCVINRAWYNIETHFNDDSVQVLLQVHDSLVFQVHRDVLTPALAVISTLSHITVPYPSPLIIPTGLKTSRTSWGDCESTPWPKQ